MPDLRLTPLVPLDEPFLWEMLYLALYVPPGGEPFPRTILQEPDIACYVQDWGRSGDWGLLAYAGGTRAGAIWLREWSGEHKGYGYISPAIPELSLALLPEYRNQGWGTLMIRTVSSLAKRRYPGLSLSVVESSPARRLYERLGFRKVGQILDSPILLLEWAVDE